MGTLQRLHDAAIHLVITYSGVHPKREGGSDLKMWFLLQILILVYNNLQDSSNPIHVWQKIAGWISGRTFARFCSSKKCRKIPFASVEASSTQYVVAQAFLHCPHHLVVGWGPGQNIDPSKFTNIYAQSRAWHSFTERIPRTASARVKRPLM